MIFMLSPLGQARPSLGLDARGFLLLEPRGEESERLERPRSLFPPNKSPNQSNWDWPELELEGTCELECVETEACPVGEEAEVDELSTVAEAESGDDEAVGIDDCIKAVEDDDDESEDGELTEL